MFIAVILYRVVYSTNIFINHIMLQRVRVSFYIHRPIDRNAFSNGKIGENCFA